MAVTPSGALPAGKIFECLALRIGTAKTIGLMESGDARSAELGRLGIGQPVRDIIGRHGDLERREHIDDERRGDEVDRAARINLRRRRGEGISPTIDHRRSEEHTSELQSLMRNSYDLFCLKK